MINVPTELTGSVEIGGIILILSTFISIVFRQSATVSILVAKVLVQLAMMVLSRHKKWSAEHKRDIARYTSDWHILKTKLKGEKLGQG